MTRAGSRRAATLEASVWLAAVSPAEPHHNVCAQLLEQLLSRQTALHQPGLFVIEVCAAIARRTRDAALAERMGHLAIGLPRLQMHELDHALAARASRIASRCALRGADAVYVATAQNSGATLLTIDHELVQRGCAEVDVSTPSDWLAQTQR